MPQLQHLAIAARDPKSLAEFYRRVFDLETVREAEGSILLSDGAFNLALLTVRPDRARGFYQIGFRVEETRGTRERLEKDGKSPTGSQVSDPDGNLVDLSAKGFALSGKKTPFPIRHIAFYTPNPRGLADFYSGVFEMREVARTDRSSIFVSDGHLNLALLYQRPEEKLGIHHFGFHVRSNQEMQRRMEEAGFSTGGRRPERIPYAEIRLHDPEGNGIDISERGWEV